MRVVHVPFTYYPDSVGGTEVYVEALVRKLQSAGVESFVAAPSATTSCYDWNGVKVYRFRNIECLDDLRALYGEGDRLAADSFESVLDAIRPDILHLHAFTSAVSVRLLEAAKRRGIWTVFTYHTPTVSCSRGTLLRYGKEVCDGKLVVSRCARCTLQGHGLGPVASRIVGSIPPFVGSALAKLGPAGRIGTAIRMSELVEVHHEAFRRLVSGVDVVIAPRTWISEVLLQNGASPEKIVLCAQGIELANDGESRDRVARKDGVVRAVFFGRLSREKGVHILIDALRLRPDLPIRLDLYCLSQREAGDEYAQNLLRKAQSDSRVRFMTPVPNGDVVETLRRYDVLVVPSQWLETGPLVVLEARAAGLPVVGSALGGLLELVEHDADGLLVDAGGEAAWANALGAIVEDSGCLDRLTNGVRTPRSMSEVCSEMAVVYQRVLSAKCDKAGTG